MRTSADSVGAPLGGPSATGDRVVRDFMTRHAVTVLDDASLADAADLLRRYDLGGLAVVDIDGRLVGVVTEADFVSVRGNHLSPREWYRLSVSDVMTIPAAVIGPDELVADAARRMSDLGVHQLFVVDDGRTPIGVIAASDVITEIGESNQ